MKRVQELLQGKGRSHIRPFLWMKGEDNVTIRQELDKIEECGIREVCLESRPHPDFCGPLWWENLDFIMKEARKRDMKVWILDDDKFPTGHANGGFRKYPEKRKIYLAERHMDIIGPCKSGAVLVENFLHPDGRLLGILAVPKPDGQSLAVSGDGIIDLTEQCENGFVYFDLPKGTYRLFILFTTYTGGGREDYMNLIDADSVRVLIDEVYEKHYEHYKDYFGNTLAGFFSDEPELGNVKGYPFDNTLGKKDGKLPWSCQLEEMLRRKWGNEFLFHLPALWYESGEKTCKVRSQYMDELTKLVKTCFSEQVGQWCFQHGVEYIGHIIEDDNAQTRMGCSIGHYFREMEGQHMAGIDVVHHQIVPGFTEPVHQWIAGDRDGEFFHYGLAKLASSAAHIQENKKGRALCEIFGNYGWAEGNSLMKWLTDHMLVRGINEFTPHAFSMNYPDRDCPPHFFARGNNPGFECFAQVMKYMNRAAHLLSEGTHVADAAILYHAEAEWSGGAFMYFHKPGRMLMEKQLDYDVIPEDVLKSGSAFVENGLLTVGNAKYPCMILPYAEKLDAKVAEFVEKIGKNGFPVFVVDGVPKEDTWGQPLSSWWTEPHAGEYGDLIYPEVVTLDALAERVLALEKDRKYRELFVEDAIPQLRSLCMRRQDGVTCMFFNESITEKVQAKIKLPKEKYSEVIVYDAWNNQADSYNILHQEIPLRLEPGEAVFLCFQRESDKTKEIRYRDFPKPAEKCELDVNWKVSRKSVLSSEFSGETILKAGNRLPNLNGPGYWPSFTGTYRYESCFGFEKADSEKKESRYYLLVPEASDCVKVSVNGIDCGWLAGFPARTDITDALVSGENSLVMEVVTTLVWSRKDGASTHLQIPASGITGNPVLEKYVVQDSFGRS